MVPSDAKEWLLAGSPPEADNETFDQLHSSPDDAFSELLSLELAPTGSLWRHTSLLDGPPPSLGAEASPHGDPMLVVEKFYKELERSLDGKRGKARIPSFIHILHLSCALTSRRPPHALGAE